MGEEGGVAAPLSISIDQIRPPKLKMLNNFISILLQSVLLFNTVVQGQRVETSTVIREIVFTTTVDTTLIGVVPITVTSAESAISTGVISTISTAVPVVSTSSVIQTSSSMESSAVVSTTSNTTSTVTSSPTQEPTETSDPSSAYRGMTDGASLFHSFVIGAIALFV